MATNLLQGCLPQRASLGPILTSSCRVKGITSATTQCRPSLVCLAAASNSGKLRSSREEESAPPVFTDDSNGIVCYTNEDGEITCEGWDEGPHFQPEPEKGYTMRTRITSRRPVARGGGEEVGFKTTGAKMGDSIREGKAETSFNSSEL